jgi:UDP-N-acetylglucosamine--N-acetylmuramyl-(pentapeptide) pyrophosphoryl-undecaprenol N-acetylglucosamine transferase
METYRRSYGEDIYFIGCAGGFEGELVTARGLELQLIPGGPFARQNSFGKLRALASLAHGIVRARSLLRAKNTGLVVGLGGYASIGAVLAARSLAIPTVIHEANVRPGLANQVLRRVVDRVLLGWDESAEFFPGSTVQVTGNPVLPEILTSASAKRSGDGEHRILVLGGSTGSRFLNRNAPLLLARVRQAGVGFSVLHQCGRHDQKSIRSTYSSAGIPADVESYVHDMAGAYRSASFVVSTAGGLTLAELAAVGLPALLVPLGEAADRHQSPNAEAFARLSGAMWVSEEHWELASLSVQVAALLGDPGRWQEQVRRLRGMARPDSAKEIASLCRSFLGRQ